MNNLQEECGKQHDDATCGAQRNSIWTWFVRLRYSKLNKCAILHEDSTRIVKVEHLYQFLYVGQREEDNNKGPKHDRSSRSVMTRPYSQDFGYKASVGHTHQLPTVCVLSQN
jgi:hypothetical protein